jgi:hypothetical protein
MRARSVVREILVASAIVVAAASPVAAAPPVLVELFTSQGCSSCPPADALLSKLAAEAPDRVVVLAFHVDSWDHEGWRDAFSSAAWTRRHEAYGRKFGSATYTPQAVVAGGTHVNGSNARELERAITAASARPVAELTLELVATSSSVAAAIAVRIPPELAGRKLDLMLAIYESGLVTQVGRGENGGKTLRNDRVVRSLERVARIGKRNAPAERYEATAKLASGWIRDRVGVAVILQDASTLEIVGAVARPIDGGAS